MTIEQVKDEVTSKQYLQIRVMQHQHPDLTLAQILAKLNIVVGI